MFAIDCVVTLVDNHAQCVLFQVFHSRQYSYSPLSQLLLFAEVRQSHFAETKRQNHRRTTVVTVFHHPAKIGMIPQRGCKTNRHSHVYDICIFACSVNSAVGRSILIQRFQELLCPFDRFTLTQDVRLRSFMFSHFGE